MNILLNKTAKKEKKSRSYNCVFSLLITKKATHAESKPSCLMTCVFGAVGRRRADPGVLPASEGSGAAVAPDGGEAVPQPAGRELQPRHAGGRRRLAAKPLCWELEGRTLRKAEIAKPQHLK